MYRDFAYPDFLFLLSSMRWTLILAAIAFVGGSILGLMLAFMRVSQWSVLRNIAAVYIRINQGVPLLMQLFMVFFGLSVVGIQVSAMVAAAICFIMNASAFLGETWRGCIQAVPKGQVEAASALGLGSLDIKRFIILPQAGRIALGPTIACLVYVIKGTSLSSLIGFVELTRAGQIINNNTTSPFVVFGIVALLYLAVCWPLSRYSAHLERVMSRGYQR